MSRSVVRGTQKESKSIDSTIESYHESLHGSITDTEDVRDTRGDRDDGNNGTPGGSVTVAVNVFRRLKQSTVTTRMVTTVVGYRRSQISEKTYNE